MLFIYMCVCLLCILLSAKLYKQIINPVTIYSVVWGICFFVHECNYIEFDYISNKTFAIIVSVHIVFFIGCLVGKYISYRFTLGGEKIQREYEDKKRLLKACIIILTFLAMIEVLPELYFNIKTYGTNIISYFSSLYNLQLYGTESALSLSSLLYVVAPLLAIYVIDYGISKDMLFPALIIIFYGLCNGSRGSLIIIILLFISPLTVKVTTNSKQSKKNKLSLYFLGAVFFSIIIICTKSRSISNNANGNGNAVINFLITYLGSGIGCLDKYLSNPVTVDYPQYFFRVIFIFLNKINITNVNITYRIPTYFIPFSSNVITYIGELFHDFQYGLFFVVFILAMIFSIVYEKAKKYNSILYRIIYSAFFVLFVLSFFANFGHSASLWYVLIFGGIISYNIDRKLFTIKK